MPVQGAFSGTDPEGKPLTAAVASAPLKGSVVISPTNPLAFTYTPTLNANGTDTFTYTVNDGVSPSAAATVTVTIGAVDDAPLIATTTSTDEDTSSSSVLIMEPDGDGFTSQILITPAHGTLTSDATNAGQFTYNPNPNFNGPDSFQLTATDTKGSSSTATVTVTVRPVNDPPVAAADDVRTFQGISARFTPLANDSDIDGDTLTVTITTPPTSGTATVNPDGSIQYTPPNAFIGATSLTYQVKDPGGLTATSTMGISVPFPSALLFRQGPSLAGPTDLYFSDGVRTFKVNAPLVGGEDIGTVRAATTAPIVYYTTARGTVTHLFRVDLRAPGVAEEIEAPSAFPGVGDSTISADGSKLVYQYSGRFWFRDFVASAPARDIGDSSQMRSPTLNPAGTRLFYQGLITQPYLSAGALFSLNMATGATPVQITPTQPPGTASTTSGVIYLSRNEDRLYYSTQDGNTGRTQILGVNPDSFGSEFVITDTSVFSVGWSGIFEDEQSFWGSHFDSSRSDYYMVKIASPGVPTNLTSDTSNGLGAGAITDDGGNLYYTRGDASGLHLQLYGVDTNHPGVSFPIGSPAPPAAHFGVDSFSIAHSGAYVVYATLDLVALSGGGATGGSTDLFYVDLTVSNTPHQLRHFVGAGAIDFQAPDDSFTVISGTDLLGNFARDLFFVNARDLSLLPINTAEAYGVAAIANF